MGAMEEMGARLAGYVQGGAQSSSGSKVRTDEMADRSSSSSSRRRDAGDGEARGGGGCGVRCCGEWRGGWRGG